MSAEPNNEVQTVVPLAASREPLLPHLHTFATGGEQVFKKEHPSTICGDVLRAAEDQAHQLSHAATMSQGEALPGVEAMLGVISYCYLKGIFDSGSIERRLWQDAAFLSNFGDKTPTAPRIRAFRRRHRAAILATIEWALVAFRKRAVPTLPATENAHAKAEHLLDMANLMDQLHSDLS